MGGTYGGNAVACAAAIATLDVFEEEGVLENVKRQGARDVHAQTRSRPSAPRW